MADNDVMQAMRLATRNPASFFKVGLDYIHSRLNGVTVPDPLSPMIQQLEIASAMACVHIEESLAGDRRNYAILAQNMRDLYSNASDYDMINRFSQPGAVKMHLMFPRNELVNAMVNVPNSQLRKVVIPRNATVLVNDDTALINLYPIEIRQPVHKGVVNTQAPLMVVYNTDLKSPMQTLDDNVVDWNVTRSPQGRDFLDISMEMLQLRRTSIKSTLVGGAYVFNQPYDTNFHFTRVFYGSDDGGWKEFATTYSEYTYNNRTPTVIVKVEESVVSYRIPPVYINSGLVPENTSIRFDIYTTEGPVDRDLTVLTSSAFKLSMVKDLDDPSLEQYSAPIRSLEYGLYSEGMLTGGSLGLTFNEMQDALINNVSVIDIPITPSQIESRLERLGFDIIKERDDITDRVYLASKTLTPATASTFNSAPASGIMTLQSKFDDLAKFPGVFDNGARLTISPETLFRLKGAAIEPVEESKYPAAVAQTTETLINLINADSYVFSPFHYVLDTNNNNFDVRAYRLADPKQTRREFIHENETTQLEISTIAFDISRTTDGYVLRVVASVGTNWQDLTESQRTAQLGFIPYGEINYAYLNGTYVGRITVENSICDVWDFPIHCTFDLDSNDNLIVNNFAIFTSTPRSLPMPLKSDFVLTYSVNDYFIDGLDGSDVDKYLGRALLPLEVWGVTAEYVGIQLGTVLSSLWANRRSLGGSIEYKKYEQDVGVVWENDVYETDPVTKARTFTIDENGEIKFNLLHSKGDPVLVDGVQKVIPAGTVMRDPGTNEPIPISDRPIMRLLEMFMVDGVYFYANDKISIEDLQYLSDSIVDTYIPTLETLSKRKLENTEIFLYPKKTIGAIPVLVDDAVEVSIQAKLSFQFLFYATETGYRDNDFRSMVESVAESAISGVLKNRTVSTSLITAKINQNLDERIAGFEVKMFSDGKAITTFTAKDDAYRATVRRMAAFSDDGKIVVKEDIKHEWDLHLPDQ